MKAVFAALSLTAGILAPVTIGETDIRVARKTQVSADKNGVVLTGKPLMDKILGPMIAFGRSPWPQMDEAHRAFADIIATRIGPDAQYTSKAWTTMWGAGTVAFDVKQWGFKKLIGIGTQFQNDFCGGPGNTERVETLRYIVVRYVDTDGSFGYWDGDILGCPSQTELQINGSYGLDRLPGPQSGLAYGGGKMFYDAVGPWSGANQDAQYYDHVMAFYSLGLRSGEQAYIEKARWLADAWMSYPKINHGYDAVNKFAASSRRMNVTGLVLRMLDGRPDYEPYLRRIWGKLKTSYADHPSDRDYGERENGYRLGFLAQGAMVDSDPAQRAIWQQAIHHWLTKPNGWLANRNAEGVWEVWPYGWHTGRVNVTHGSPVVRKTDGTTFNASYHPTYYFYSCNDAGQCDPAPVSYKVKSVDSPTQITLTMPYEGSTETNRKWQIRNLVGPGTQPFFMGIVGVAMFHAADALRISHPETSQAAEAAGIAIARWITTKGHDALHRGLWYGRYHPNCEPDPQGRIVCDQGSASNNYTAEVVRVLSEAYMRTRDPQFRVQVDRLYGAMWGKAGYGGPHTTGQYAYDCATPTRGKYFGFCFGFGAAPAWPAARTK